MGHFVSSAQSSRNEMCPLLLVVNFRFVEKLLDVAQN